MCWNEPGTDTLKRPLECVGVSPVYVHILLASIIHTGQSVGIVTRFIFSATYLICS